MRYFDTIIVHCTATRVGREVTAAEVDAWHKERGFNCIGYHYLIRLDGTIEKGRSLNRIGAHCKGHNGHSVGICYVGGLDENGLPCDTRTPAQKDSLARLIWMLTQRALLQGFGLVAVRGHRDFAKVDCPCFDAAAEYD